MARHDHPVFESILDALAASAGDVVVDLGCGRGPALHALIERDVRAELIGVDLNRDDIDLVRSALPSVRAVMADLDERLPFDDGSVDRVLCHNVIECLADPTHLIREVRRIMRPGGRAVLSHVDFDGIIIAGPDRSLTRRVIHSYADHAPEWMAHADGQMGRQLAGLARRADLVLVDATIHTTTSVHLDGDAIARVDEISLSLAVGTSAVTPAEVQQWRRMAEDTDESGKFFFSEPCVIVTVEMPG